MDKRARRRARRETAYGPLRELVNTFVRNGVDLEKLSCGHEAPAGPSRQTQSPGKVWRHCPVCPKPELVLQKTYDVVNLGDGTLELRSPEGASFDSRIVANLGLDLREFDTIALTVSLVSRRGEEP